VVERDVVLAKVATIDRCLRRLAEVREPGRGLDPQDVEDLLELNLQRAVQAAIDLAAHVVSTEGYGMPGTLAETFTLLERQEVIPPELAERLRRMSGFRNIAIHEYATIDPEIVRSIVDDHLDDLRELCRSVIERFRLGDRPTSP
jgi:uncharacterized protein YutE (UPF0331/DUF86 family)